MTTATPFKSHQEIMAEARQKLSGKWNRAAGLLGLYYVAYIILQCIPIVGAIVCAVVSLPIGVGIAGYHLDIARGHSPTYERIRDGFKQFWKIMGTYLLMFLFIAAGFLALIIPGIIISMSFIPIAYVLIDNPEKGVMDTLRHCWSVMKGHRWNATILASRFIGWALLSCLTVGIGFLWLLPYMKVSTALFYEDITSSVVPRENNDF